MSPHTKNPESSRANGYQAEICFEHQGRSIQLLGSLYSGRERVYVDDELVSDRRSWRFSNQHSFEAGGVRYVLEVRMKKSARNILFGIIDLRLLADGVLIDSDQFNGAQYLLSDAAKNQPLTWRGWLALLPFVLAGAVAGFAVAYYALNHLL